MRAFSAVPIAIVICAAAPAFADAQSSVQAAKKAERKGEWRKALEAWKAAYSSDVNAEYLIGIGDAYAHLGNKDEAKKNYEAYLADPLALPANVEKVKTKIAELDNPAGGGLALPGGPGLALPGAPPLPGASTPPLPGLDLPGAAPVADKKGKHKKGSEPPPLPGLDLPGAPPAQVAEKKAEPGPGLALPGLDLPGAAPAPSKKEPEKKVASASPGLDLSGLPVTPTPAAKPEKKEPPVVATSPSPTRPIKGSSDGKQVAMTTPSKPEPRRVPEAAIAETPAPRSQSSAESGGTARIVAFVAAGVAVVSLGGGALAFTKAGSAHSDLIGKVHTGAEAQSLLETEAKNKTLSFVGFAGGLVAAGIATALFAF
jgi:hypothetical protein